MTVPLFTSLRLRGVTLKNRIAVSPMCQYSCTDGYANDWTFQHLASRAAGGSALVFTEATAVVPEGRISPADLGIWSDSHIEPLARITRFIASQGAVSGIQLAHAGRKASAAVPWEGGRQLSVDNGGWETRGPSAVPFHESERTPHALTLQEIRDTIDAFVQAATRAITAGFDVIELHGAHGYLLHEFLSPLANMREDEYGGSFDNRTRLIRETTEAVRRVIPDRMPLVVRISATDWTNGGWDIEQSVELSRALQPLGVDLIDCSTGGIAPRITIPAAPGYQVQFAERIRREAGIMTGAVGLITTAEQANALVADGSADLVLLARELLRNPTWPHRAAKALGVSVPWPVQYERARD
jgi:2,4-dienoyl-CoA reductase-like NADH-dependent reductase (Old Yellow Enzyme family)